MMIAESFLKGKRVVVAGMGVSGVSATRWLLSCGSTVSCYDFKTFEDLGYEAKHLVKEHDLKFLSEKDDLTCFFNENEQELLVISPGIPKSARIVGSAEKAKCKVVGDLALAAAFWKGPLIAVTGTNGKTTTVKIISRLFEQAGFKHVTAGNISPPLSEFMEKNNSEVIALLEVSSFQLEYFPEKRDTSLPLPEFKVAAFLNLAPDHLDRHSSLKEYGRCKSLVFKFLSRDGFAVINADDENINPLMDVKVKKRFLFSRKESDFPGAFIDDNKMEIRLHLGEGEASSTAESYSLNGWKASGRHNQENLACAITIARLLGIDSNSIISGIKTFSPPGHRLATVAYIGGVRYINDSKATNVAAVLRALESLEGRVVLVAGGTGKNEDYQPLAKKIMEINRCGFSKRGGGAILSAVLIGKEKKELRKALSEVIRTVEIDEQDGRIAVEKAVLQASEYTEPGDTVLFSPACASFDMFRDYKERGEVFCDAVKSLCCFGNGHQEEGRE